jgi:hypothetical protein
MNGSHKNTLYIILNYSFNENIYNLVSSIEKFCFSFISVSLQYNFQFYIIYNNFYSLLFPNKPKDPTYFFTSNYSGIHESIEESLNHFLSLVPELDDKLFQEEQNDEKIEKNYPMNVIFKKILLEVNKKNLSNTSYSPGGFFLGMGIGDSSSDKIILINDSEEDFGNINQKYVFLFKEKGVKINILSLNKKNKNDVSKAICFFTKGIFDCISDSKNNIEQMLISEYMPIKFCENIPKINHDIKYTISYNKTISDNNLICSVCNKEMNNNKDIYGKNMNVEDEIKKKYNKCLYTEKEKNIFCLDCYNKMIKQ